jgi:outer membrane protein assembly factor BamB
MRPSLLRAGTPLLTVAVLAAACADTSSSRVDPAADHPSAMFRGGEARTGVYQGEGPTTSGAVEWTVATGGPVRSSPTVVRDRVYVGSGDGHVYALDAETGSEVWTRDLGSPVHSTPAVAHGLVFVIDWQNRLFALDQASGETRWRAETGPDAPWDWGQEGWDYFSSSPAVEGGRVYVGSGDGHVYAFEARSGAEIWRFATGGRVRSSPALADGRLFVGSADGVLYALDSASGELVWRFETVGAGLDSEAWGFDRKTIQGTPAVVDGRVYFGARDGHAYAVDARSGEQLWRTEERMPWYIASPAVADGVLYLGSSDGLFVNALDAATGRELWRTATGHRVFSSPALFAGTLFVGNHLGRFLALAPETGEIRWELRARHGILSSPVPGDGRVYFGSDDGKVYSVKLTDTPPPRRAVFWDSAAVARTTLADHEELRRYLAGRGYEVLDAAGLANFLAVDPEEEGVGVVVFAQDHLPEAAAPREGDAGLLRAFLERGGKAVWLGYPPGFLEFDADGAVSGLNQDIPRSITGAAFDDHPTDRYPAYPTSEGIEWGLDGWWIGEVRVEPTDGMEVLARDEMGRVAAWAQGFGGSRGTGFVYLWGNTGMSDPAVYRRVLAVAEAGVGTVLGAGALP